MKQQLRKNLSFGKPLLMLLFSLLMIAVLFGNLLQETKAESGSSPSKGLRGRNCPGLTDYQTGVSICEQTENLVLNPGFEEGIRDQNHWHYSGSCRFQEFHPGHDSDTSARIFAGYKRDEQCILNTPGAERVPVETGRFYDYAAWMKTDLLLGDAYLRISFWDADWNYKGKGETTAIEGTQDWIKVTGSVQAPPGAEYARVQPTIPPLSVGSAWFDDIFFGLATCLEIGKSDDPDPVERGQVLTYTIVYSNVGREKATDVWVIDTFDEYVDPRETEPDPWLGTDNIWRFAELLPGASGTITAVVEVEGDTGERAYLFNNVQILSDETEEPFHATISTLITPPMDGCDINFYIPDAEKSGRPGRSTNYDVVLENPGACDGQADLAYTSSQGWDVTITPPPPYILPSGSSQSLTVSPIVPQCELSGTEDVILITTNLACAECKKTVIETAKLTTTVARQVGVDIEADVSKLPPINGTTVTFTHTVTNTGNWTDTIAFSYDFPDGIAVDIEPSQIVNLGPCQAESITIIVGNLTSNMELTGTITATSTSDPNEFDKVIDEIRMPGLYLPLVTKSYCYCAPNEMGNSCFVSPCDFAPWWVEEGALRRKVVLVGEDVYNPFGCCSARLGDPTYDNNSGEIPVNDRATIHQTVIVPDTSSPELVFTYAMYSYHIMEGGITGRIFDSFEVAIDDPNNFIFRTGNPEGIVPNDCRHTVWQSGVQSESLDLTPYAGQTITIYLSVWNRIHGGCNTWAYIDSVQLLP